MTDIDTERWRQRGLERDARFVLPLLRPGLAVVDVGCGPGTITLGLAERVAPGRVLGIDIDAGRIAAATDAARTAGIANAAFQVADAAALPMPADSVDIVFANGLIEHPPDPAAIVAGFARVLRPGGRVALRSPDWGAAIVQPASPDLLRAIDLRNAWQRHGRGDPEAGRKLTGLLAAAGFTGIAAHAEADADTGDAARARDYMLRILGDPDLAALARRRGWATPAEIALSADAWAEWATRPDAFAAFFWCTAVATKPTGGL